jgi:hypothetical protein
VVSDDVFRNLVQSMFQDDEFALLSSSSQRCNGGVQGTEEVKDPDIRYLHGRSQHIFWVECRFRQDTYYDKVQWSTPEQLKHLMGFQKEVGPETVYIIIGLGGTPHRPDQMFCIPLREAITPSLSLAKLREYEHHDRRQPFKYAFGRLR